MTAIRKEAIELLERVPEDKLSFVIQIMRGVNGLLGDTDNNAKKAVDLEQFFSINLSNCCIPIATFLAMCHLPQKIRYTNDLLLV